VAALGSDGRLIFKGVKKRYWASQNPPKIKFHYHTQLGARFPHVAFFRVIFNKISKEQLLVLYATLEWDNGIGRLGLPVHKIPS